ncbi:MAG TPA: sulfate ABC transporter substrate-binding protein, partial [Thermoleophilaceae bacterium]
MRTRTFISLLLAVAALATAVAVSGCGSSSSAEGSSGGKVALVAYSTPQEAYEQLIPAFQKTSAGKGVTFSQSYGASGDQARAVTSGLPADVAEFSLAPDMDKLVKAGLVDSGWDQNKWHGFVTDSVVTLVVRKGNPKGIHDWGDLVKPGVQVIEPNPFTSGSARWNVMAAYGAQIKQGKSPQQAEAYLQQLFKNVVVQDKSARDAMQTFTSGKGDVLIAYENEAINAQQQGKAVDYVTPSDTILIQNPIAVTKDAKPAAAKFVNWLHTDQAQKIF